MVGGVREGWRVRCLCCGYCLGLLFGVVGGGHWFVLGRFKVYVMVCVVV